MCCVYGSKQVMWEHGSGGGMSNGGQVIEYVRGWWKTVQVIRYYEVHSCGWIVFLMIFTGNCKVFLFMLLLLLS